MYGWHAGDTSVGHSYRGKDDGLEHGLSFRPLMALPVFQFTYLGPFGSLLPLSLCNGRKRTCLASKAAIYADVLGRTQEVAEMLMAPITTLHPAKYSRSSILSLSPGVGNMILWLFPNPVPGPKCCIVGHHHMSESGNVNDVFIFPPSNVAFLSSLWTDLAKILGDLWP